VLIVAESIYDGTWASGPPPAEVVDFELCLAMHWSWQELQVTPLYVRRAWWDLLQTRRRCERAQHEREMERARRGW
jgi:hypothetical protein